MKTRNIRQITQKTFISVRRLLWATIAPTSPLITARAIQIGRATSPERGGFCKPEAQITR